MQFYYTAKFTVMSPACTACYTNWSVKQSITSFKEVTTSSTFVVSWASSPIKPNIRSNQTYDQTKRTIKPSIRTRPTDGRQPTNQIKSSERQNKVFAKTPIGPYLTFQNLKITTSTESKSNLILDKPSDWTQWFFIIQDTTKTNKVWEYIDLSQKKDDLLTLKTPK